MKTFSQYKQDYFIDSIFKHKENGFFLDIGANDGITFSNSYFFEKYRNWSGICVEPHVDIFKKLSKVRTCILENCCITDKDGVVTFRKVSGPDMLSGVLEFMDRVDSLDEHIRMHGGSYEDIKIASYNINSLLKKHNVTKIDFCSIDVEGGEWAIINSIDFDHVNISAFSVEGNDERILSFLKSKGYTHIYSETDTFYIKDSIRNLESIKREVKRYKFRCKLKRHVPSWLKKYL
ncbi:MAG: FkbM family methyltransferase [Tannerella sp.]|jgi:FkbM family methyltransferase|nr:FkbM family methyltransferase [Tannerella sp.]